MVTGVVFEILGSLVDTEKEEGEQPIIEEGRVFDGMAGIVGLGEEQELRGKAGKIVMGESVYPSKRFIMEQPRGARADEVMLAPLAINFRNDIFLMSNVNVRETVLACAEKRIVDKGGRN